MKRLLFGSTLCALGLFLLPTQEANAACVFETGPSQASRSNPAYGARYGSWIDIFAKTTGDLGAECGTKRTDINNYPTYLLSKENSESSSRERSDSKVFNEGLPTEYTLGIKASAKASANLSRASVTSTVNRYNGAYAFIKGNAELVDLIQIYSPLASPTSVVLIPVEFCSELSSEYESNGSEGSSISYKDYNTISAEHGTDYSNKDLLVFDGNYTISHSTNGEVCRTGHLKMTGNYTYFSIKLKTYTLGNPATLTVPTTLGNTTTITSYDGSITADFKISLPSGLGLKCHSASGSFRGCARPIKTPKVCMADASGGNPINYALGVKHQTETDYSGGLLSLNRMYRSDFNNESGMFGENWRHNFDRIANIITTAETNTVDVTDADGSTIIFLEDSSTGDWNAVTEGVTSSFVSLYDGTPTLIGYLYTTSNDTREYYNLDGLMTRIEYLGGEALDFTHDGSDRLSTVTNEQGKSLTFSYNGSDQITSVVTPTGTFSYTYDGDNNLSTVTRPDSEVRTYHYEDTTFLNALTGITDENGVRFATWTYDTEGRPISSEHAGGVESFDVAYNSDGTVTTTNALGKDTVYTFEMINGVKQVVNVDGVASTNCAAASRGKTYDAQGFLTSKTDWAGNITDYIRNDDGLITSRTEDANGVARTTDTTYEAAFKLPDVITETDKTTDYDYDGEGRRTSVTVTDTNTSETRITSFSYYSNTTDGNGNTVLGRLYQVNGARTDVSDVTTYTYDGSGRLIKTANAVGHESETTSFDSANRPLIIEDANNIQTSFVYDSLGRVTSSTAAYGTASAATTSYTYDDNGNVLTITQPNGVVTTNSYDTAERLTGIEDNMGNTITYTLDNAGNITKEEYKAGGTTLKYTMDKVYDELSRIIESVDANTDSTAFAYDVNSNQTSVTDANMNVTSAAFDGLDRLVSQTDALSGVTSFDLNELNQNEGTTDPRSNETSYSYNEFGDVTQEVSPDRGTRSYSHDKAGNVTSMTDARSVVTNYTYDAINRLTSVAYPSDSSLNQSLTYDSASGCGTSKGRLCSVTDASGVTAYIYDVLGRLTDVTETRSSLSFTTSYAYDAAGALISITLPSGREIDYTLNANGQVSGVSADVNSTSTTLASGITYLPFGGVTGLTYGNSIALTNTYNTAYQLTAKQHGSLSYESYTYDYAGNITATSSDSYTLDDLYRITADNSDSYTYDAIGNRTAKNATSYTYPSTSSRLTDIGASSITTDTAGNITADVTRTYVIDAAGHVEQVKVSGATVGAYVYNASNQRTQKTASSTVTHYVYGAGGLLFGEYDNTGALIREYVYLNAQPLAQVDSGEVLSYLHTDHLGTPRYASNTSGVEVWNWASDAFGVGTPTGSATVNLRFSGQYFDAESDLHYNWNRYYDPSTGRYISSDPIGLSGGVNTFGYVLANPIMYTDPEGLYTLHDASTILVSNGFVPTPSNVFDMWLALEDTHTGWLNQLKSCPKEITMACGLGIASYVVDPTLFKNPNRLIWHDVEGANYFHPGAVYELRSKTFGHSSTQCNYTREGKLITKERPAAGTADLFAPEYGLQHSAHDVETFSAAKVLDRLDDYYRVRPSL